MENYQLVGLMIVSAVVIVGAAIIQLRRAKRSTDAFVKEESIKFNHCIDLLLEDKIVQAKEAYNALAHIDNNRPFINGVICGMTVNNSNQSKERLLNEKYKIR